MGCDRVTLFKDYSAVLALYIFGLLSAQETNYRFSSVTFSQIFENEEATKYFLVD